MAKTKDRGGGMKDGFTRGQSEPTLQTRTFVGARDPPLPRATCECRMGTLARPRKLGRTAARNPANQTRNQQGTEDDIAKTRQCSLLKNQPKHKGYSFFRILAYETKHTFRGCTRRGPRSRNAVAPPSPFGSSVRYTRRVAIL